MSKKITKNKVWYEVNKDKVSEYKKSWYQASGRQKWLYKAYGLTIAEFNNIFTNQNGCCAICRRDRELVVDHCHKTGRVRGLLCKKCNTAIGLLDENSEHLRSAIEYLNTLHESHLTMHKNVVK